MIYAAEKDEKRRISLREKKAATKKISTTIAMSSSIIVGIGKDGTSAVFVD
jgi:hypothetical protein